MADRAQQLEWSFVSTLVGGIVLLVSGLWMALMTTVMADTMPMMMGRDGFGGMMMALMSFGAFASLAAGIAGIVAAARIRSRPETAGTWGIVAIVAGGVSLLGFGGGLIGAAALIGGGILALMATKADAPATRQPF